ncbi:Hint domain-containing protein [Pseudosulfitobacter sp. DSM 107133]|uniref:Hint domain-containing protein n=1 Tax=Pseudosulfitobacter sp. DSM 107133 TaxID=2883100 RepID=UPI000DF1C9F8|nr:Hint domain-containing protein [Pseudosulfitobacter sp. DSM 107133]UOA26497.1 hypothetical protein DSM107133_01197 [Pseudosulfitobacter sp. DSM 107133]
MPTYSFHAFGFDVVSTTGPDPFASDNTGNASAVSSGSTIRIDADAVASEMVLTDNEGIFEDADGGQDLVQGVVLNGTAYDPGENIQTEYAYVVRPVGSVDAADNITIYVLEIHADAQGIASDSRLIPGVEYRILSIASNDPEVAYADMAVCYLRGTGIAVPGGERAVEEILCGDLVSAIDSGPQGVVWRGQQTVSGRGRLAPIRIAAGTLDNDRDLFVSPQHRILVASGWAAPLDQGRAHLVPAKALVGLPGITTAPRRVVHYHHILCAAHHLVRANGAISETMLPGAQALAALGPVARTEINTLLGQAVSMPTVRPCLRVGQWHRIHSFGQPSPNHAPAAVPPALCSDICP